MRVLVLAFTVIFLVGCGTSKAPATRFYVLTSLDPGVPFVTEPHLKAPLAVEVSSLHLPQYLERPQIVTRSTENRIELAEFHQWGGNLRKNMMRVLARNLSQLLATPQISIFPHSPQAAPDFRVDLEIMKFERDPQGKVQLSAQWRVSGSGDRKALITQFTDLESPPVETGHDLEPTVSAMSALWGELSQEIGRVLLQLARKRLEP